MEHTHTENSNCSSKLVLFIVVLALAVSNLYQTYELVSGYRALSNAYTQVTGRATLIQGTAERLVDDLLRLSKTNDTARRVVDDFKIRKEPRK
jgi:hypothetical protein